MTAAPGDAVPPGEDEPIELRHRRAPRYGRFIVAGIFGGALVSFLLAVVTRGWSGLSAANTFWLLLLSLGVIGMGAGAALAYLLDRRSLAAMDRQAAPPATARAEPTP